MMLRMIKNSFKHRVLHTSRIILMFSWCWSHGVSAQSPELLFHADALAGPTALAPSPPSWLDFLAVPPLNKEILVVGSEGGEISVSFSAKDPAATNFPGSLKIGTMNGAQCFDASQKNSSLPQGSSLVSTDVSSSIVSGVFRWNVPKDAPPTKIVFCAYNQFWIIQSGQLAQYPITIVASSPAKSVTLLNATFDIRKGVLSARGKADPLFPGATNGVAVSIQDMNGIALGSGLFKGARFSMSAPSVLIPDQIQAIIGTTESKPRAVKIIGRPPCKGECVTITSYPPAPGINLGQTWLYQVKATDSKGLPLSYSLIDAPPGASIDAVTGKLSFLSPDPGVFSFAVKASSDSGALAIQQLRVTVCAQGTYWMNGMGGMCM